MLFQKKCLPLLFFTVVAASFICGCKSDAQHSPQNYAFTTPVRITLGKALNEVSGICYNEDDSTLLAVSDSKERVFQMNVKTKKLRDYTDKIVDPDSDLEDLVKVDTAIFLLSSKGMLIEIKAGRTDSTGMKTYDLGLPGTNDFETVYYDPTAKGLVLLCKTCAHEKGQGIRTAYRFDLAKRAFDSTAFFTISKDAVRALIKNSDAKFDPSAAAISPVNKRLYILSSAGNLLVITDTRGKVAEAYTLNPDDFPQAEGIAFAPNGTMYITNEGKNGKPTLLVFPYQHGKKK